MTLLEENNALALFKNILKSINGILLNNSNTHPPQQFMSPLTRRVQRWNKRKFIIPLFFSMIIIFVAIVFKHFKSKFFNSSISIHVENVLITDKWKIIPNNASVPPGLEVEINMETGVKRARLPSFSKDPLQSFYQEKKEELSINTINNKESQIQTPHSYKWQRKYYALHNGIIVDNLKKALKGSDDALSYLEENAHDYSIGAGLMTEPLINDIIDLIIHTKDGNPDLDIKILLILKAAFANNFDAVNEAIKKTRILNVLLSLLSSASSPLIMDSNSNIGRIRLALSVLISLIQQAPLSPLREEKQELKMKSETLLDPLKILNIIKEMSNQVNQKTSETESRDYLISQRIIIVLIELIMKYSIDNKLLLELLQNQLIDPSSSFTEVTIDALNRLCDKFPNDTDYFLICNKLRMK